MLVLWNIVNIKSSSKRNTIPTTAREYRHDRRMIGWKCILYSGKGVPRPWRTRLRKDPITSSRSRMIPFNNLKQWKNMHALKYQENWYSSYVDHLGCDTNSVGNKVERGRKSARLHGEIPNGERCAQVSNRRANSTNNVCGSNARIQVVANEMDVEKKQENFREHAYNQFRLANLYPDNADKSKYGSIITAWLNIQQSLGNDQYPRSITEANNVLGNHRFDISQLEWVERKAQPTTRARINRKKARKKRI